MGSQTTGADRSAHSREGLAMVKVKICGITNLEDALAAVNAGADALGFNFYRRSRRFIEPLAAGEIVRQLPADLLTVGVFVNEPRPDDVKRLADQAGVSAVQLHGDESPEYCGSLAEPVSDQSAPSGRELYS